MTRQEAYEIAQEYINKDKELEIKFWELNGEGIMRQVYTSIQNSAESGKLLSNVKLGTSCYEYANAEEYESKSSLVSKVLKEKVPQILENDGFQVSEIKVSFIYGPHIDVYFGMGEYVFEKEE